MAHTPYTSSNDTSQMICWQLESIARQGVDAVNTRNFNPNVPPWTSFSSNFENITGRSSGPPATWASPSSSINRDSKTAPAPPVQPLEPEPESLAAFLKFERGLATTNPDYYVQLLDVECTFASKKAQYAAVIMSAQIHGLPAGIVRPILMAWDFTYVKEKWVASRITTLHGVSPPI